MKCPHCGKDMRQDQVFCENCGKERLLVPVFEPELEARVAESMSSIIQELSPDDEIKDELNIEEQKDAQREKITSEKEKNPEKTASFEKKKKKKSFMQAHFWIAILIAVVILVASFSIFFYIYTQNSYEYLYKKAQEAFVSQDYSEAQSYADRALAADNTRSECKLLKIYIYQQQGKIDRVVEKCEAYIAEYPDGKEAYETLIPYLIERKQYRKLKLLLEECRVDSVVEKYADFTAFAPDFGMEEGTYDSAVSLKLISNGTGNIYYTLDGTAPNKYSDRYTAPIKLVSGRYEVSAIYINNYEVGSDIVTKTYTIASDISFLPEVSADSGNYDVPQLIKVSSSDEDAIIYYTTDGEDPTVDSNIYSVPFAMPIGHSVFKFMMMDGEGNESEIVSRSYDCNPSAVYSVDQAIIILKQNMIARGEMLDMDGTVAGSEEKKQYVCNSVVEKDGIIYYVIYEYLQNAKGSMTRTGNTYGFGILDGALCRLSMTSGGIISSSVF